VYNLYFSSNEEDSAGQLVITGLGEKYIKMSEEAIFLNTIGVILIALAVVMPVIIGCGGFRRGLVREGDGGRLE
jgi:hypothetical protein